MYNCAFLVGCGDYTSSHIPNIKGIDVDLAIMKEALTHFCECSVDDTYEISDEDSAYSQPTGGNIFELLHDKAQKYSKQSINNFYFYFSGHGYISKDGEAIIVPKDAVIDDFLSIYHGIIPLSTVTNIIKKLYMTTNIIIILDMCLDDIASKSFSSTDINLNHFPKGVIVFHSCEPHQKSYLIPEKLQDKFGQGSIFTHVFAEALKQRECCTVSQIDTYIKANIQKYTKELRKNQRPFTSLQDVSLFNVLIKKEAEKSDGIVENTKELDDSSTLWDNGESEEYSFTEDELKELDIVCKSNAVEIEIFTEHNRKQIFDLASQINLNEIWLITFYGENTFYKIKTFKETYTYRFSSPSSSGLEREEEFFQKLIINKVSNTKKGLSSFFPLFHTNSSNQIVITDNDIEESLDRLIKSIQEYQICCMKNTANLDKWLYNLRAWYKELLMYLTAGHIYINRNPELDSLTFQRRLDSLDKYACSLSGIYNVFRKTKENCANNIVACGTYRLTISNIKARMYKDITTAEFCERYSQECFLELIALIGELRDNISLNCSMIENLKVVI